MILPPVYEVFHEECLELVVDAFVPVDVTVATVTPAFRRVTFRLRR